jgi:ParB-like chromosome segregation protein Spo0J
MLDRHRLPTRLVSPESLDLRLQRLHTPSSSAVDNMATSLAKYGQISPVIAADDGQCLILADGFKRQAAAKVIGLSHLVVMCVDTSLAHTKALMYLANRTSGFSMIAEALLVRELVEVDGLKQSEAASLLERHKSWVSRRLDIIGRLAPEIVEELKLNLVPGGSAPSLARLPQCNQVDFSAAIQTHRLRPQQISRLVDLWCKAKEPAQKKFLLDFPHQALNIVNENRTYDQKGVKWHKEMRTIIEIATKMHEAFRQAPPKVNTQSAKLLRQLVHEAEMACQKSFDMMRKAISKEVHDEPFE